MDLLNVATTNTVSGWDILWITIINVMLLVAIKFMFDGIDVLAGVKPRKLEVQQFINYSSLIGLIERALYIIGFWIQSAELITLVIAVKTIMRFTSVSAAEKSPTTSKAGDQKLTAEKYILGTLLNVFIAIVIVFMFK